jgi:phage terminase large subunit-like protein
LSVASTNSRKRGSARPLTVSEHAEACRDLIVLDNGLPLVLEGFQRGMVADLLSGIRELHVRIPEENGKTTLLAAITLIHLLSKPDPRVAIGARNKDQAKILFNQSLKMVQGCPSLESRLDIRDGTNEIRIRGMKGGAGLRVIPADELTAHGGIYTLVVLDEMHALPGVGLYTTLAGKIRKRNGQLVGISTAGEPDSEYEQLWASVLATAHTIEHPGPRCIRAVGPHHVAWGWALEAEDDHEDLELVKQANPASWITLETLAEKRALPGWELAHWLKVVCNRPTRDQVTRFLSEGDWDAANIGADCPTIPEGVPVFVGVDWGLTEDATVYSPAWYDDGYLLLGAPTIVNPPRNGHDLTHDELKKPLLELNERNPIAVIAHDETMGGKILTSLLAEWLPGTEIIPVTLQDANAAPFHFNDQLRGGKLKHTGDPDLKRHLMNAIRVPIKDDPEKYRIARPKASRHATYQRQIREIDAAVAAVNAVWAAVGREPTPEPFFALL